MKTVPIADDLHFYLTEMAKTQRKSLKWLVEYVLSCYVVAFTDGELITKSVETELEVREATKQLLNVVLEKGGK